MHLKFKTKNCNNACVSNCSPRKAAFGFTLTEILITLTVIGIVALLTIPVVYSNYQKHSWEVGKKKFIKRLIEVTNMMNTNKEFGGLDSSQTFVNKLTNYLNNAQTCTNDNLAGCFSSKIVQEDGKTFKPVSYYKDAKALDEIFISNTAGVKLADGQNMIVAYNPACPNPAPNDPTLCLSVLYDVNGDRKPNTLGKDIYKLTVRDIEKYLPKSTPSTSIPDSTTSGGITDGSDNTGGTTNNDSSTSNGDNTGNNTGSNTPPPGNPNGNTSGENTGGGSTGEGSNNDSDNTPNAGGGYKRCLYNEDVLGFCITRILSAHNGGYSGLSYEDCTSAKNNGQIDVNVCYNGSDPDYYAGAVLACGGKKNNLPTLTQLGKLATEVYNYPTLINAQDDIYGGLTLDKEKAAPFLSQAIGGSDNSPWFPIWSNEEANTTTAYYRNFFSTRTTFYNYGSNGGFRYTGYILAVCVNTQ